MSSTDWKESKNAHPFLLLSLLNSISKIMVIIDSSAKEQ